MSNQVNLLGYFFQAGIVVKLVMLLLLSASILSWTIIIQRALFFRQKKHYYQAFTRRFWACSELGHLFQEVDTAESRNGLAAIFHAGFKEFLRLRQLKQVLVAPIERAMMIRHHEEASLLEAHLSLLSSIGSIAPYVGLFGTVWGIMASLQALGQAQQASIAMVAPGISEALIATALGLFTAIPAVVAFHRYSQAAQNLQNSSELFQEKFISLIETQVMTTRGVNDQ